MPSLFTNNTTMIKIRIKYKRTIILKLILLIISIGMVQQAASQEYLTKLPAENQKTIKEYISNIEKFEANKNPNSAVMYKNKLAYYLWQLELYNPAIEYFNQVLEYNNKSGNKNGIRTVIENLGMIYSDQEQYTKAYENFIKVAEMSKAMGDKAKVASAYNSAAYTMIYQKKYNEAVALLEKALENAQELNHLKLIRTCYGSLYEVYEKLGNQTKYQEYYMLYSTFNQYIKEQEIKEIEIESAVKIARAEAEKHAKELELELQSYRLNAAQDSLLEAEQINKEQQLQIRVLNQEKEMERQQKQIEKEQARLKVEKTIRNSILFFLILMIISLILIIKQYREKQKANKLLEEQNIKLKLQKEKIEQQSQLLEEKNEELAYKNKQIVDSINYASKIQEAILPSRKAIRNNLPNSFIFYRPKDIVSGDFYWFSKQKGRLFIAAVDCTGHSVPGAFMSRIGNTLLNGIVNEKKIFQPTEILTKLNAGVIQALKQHDPDGGTQDDGMDVSLCCIDKENKEIEFANANHNSIIISNGKLIVVEGAIFSIGGMFSSGDNVKFHSRKISIEKETSLFLFSDGYQDQFGGDNNQKFRVEQLEKIIYENRHLNMEEQGQIIESTFDQWKGDAKQIDDVLVIGIKLNG